MSRMVPFHDGITLSQLEHNIMKEFSLEGNLGSVALSYWPPTTLELATGIRTPPVLLTNEGDVRYFRVKEKPSGERGEIKTIEQGKVLHMAKKTPEEPATVTDGVLLESINVVVEVAVTFGSGEVNDGEDDVLEVKELESVVEGDKDGDEEEEDEDEERNYM
ncbi:hypothetical protein YC2023_033615 [Brassica napus]